VFGSESESLQADVMRFMAIIAFCLIAILGLARQAERETATAAPEPSPRVEPEPVPPSAAAEEEGLSLRFASEGDFLRLVSRGTVEVFAFREADVLALDPSLRLLESRAPGRVHEVLPETVPDLVLAQLREARADASAFRWAVRLPPRIEGRIREHLAADARGALVIDRLGEVRHEPAG
jgi:hypothetical protein